MKVAYKIEIASNAFSNQCHKCPSQKKKEKKKQKTEAIGDNVGFQVIIYVKIEEQILRGLERKVYLIFRVLFFMSGTESLVHLIYNSHEKVTYFVEPSKKILWP